MLVEIILFLLAGVVAGTITGLTPGIHINLVSGILLTISFVGLNPVYLVTFITSMAITHTFTDFIPSVFLGCPDTDTELSILPGHNLLKNKKGYEAVHLSNIGSLIAVGLLVLILLPSIYVIGKLNSVITSIIPYLLIAVSLMVILTEQKKLSALFVFLLTGILGYSLTNFQFNEPLLPLLTGLFGASNIILSIKSKTKIPEQEITKSEVKLKQPILGALASAPFCSFLPGIGAGQAAVIGNTFVKNNEKQFLVLLGIINTLVMGFSFISLYLLGKTRTGTAVAIKQILGNVGTNYLILIIAVSVFVGILAFNWTETLAKFFSRNFKKINYQILSYSTLAILTLVVLLISGIFGILILIISTLTGIYSINLKVKRTNMMGSLIIPTILFYLGVG